MLAPRRVPPLLEGMRRTLTAPMAATAPQMTDMLMLGLTTQDMATDLLPLDLQCRSRVPIVLLDRQVDDPHLDMIPGADHHQEE